MAVYGRYKERWDPTRPKAKTTKNRTYELKRTDSLGGTLLPGDKLYELIKTEDISTIGSTDYVGGSLIVDSANKGYQSFSYVLEGKDYASLEEIESGRFREKAIKFIKSGDAINGFDRSYIRPANANTKYTAGLFAAGRSYTTYISFYVRIDSQDFHESDGHSFGGLYRNGANNDGTTIENQDPLILFSIGSSGQLIIRYLDPIDTSDVVGNGTYTPDHVVWEVDTTERTIDVDEWAFCTIAFTPYASIGTDNVNLKNSVKLWIDGISVPLTTHHFGTVQGSTDGLEWRLGNTGNTFDDRIVSPINLSDGFAGSLGVISLITQTHANESQWNSFAKFLYEAHDDGVYALHSGVHNGGPRVQLLDKDRDSSYPPSHIIDTYTKYDDAPYFAKKTEQSAYPWKETNRSSLNSDITFIEGFNTQDQNYAWKENPSQYFVNSSTSIPYLGLDPSDTILTNGNWYSDARSEFFDEDLETVANEGFGVTSTADHTPSNNGELYRRHANLGNNGLFVEENIPDEYKDCIVIEIPIPSEASLTLSTDGDSDQERRQLGTSAIQTSQQSINTMAYYNFQTNRWEHTVNSYSTDSPTNSTPTKFNWLDNGDIGFGPLTGLILPKKQEDLEYIVDLYGRPISDFGFPFADKFSSSAGQSIDMSKYIDEPVILKGWEMYQKVVPKVGYQHDGNTVEGPDIYYSTTNTFNTATLVGERNKVVFSPSSAVNALAVTTVPGILFGDYNFSNSLIDVYYNGEIQKPGTLTETTNGQADYFIDADASPNAQIKFRYPLSTNAKISVIARKLGGGTRSKTFFSTSGTITAGQNVLVTGIQFGSSPNLELIDVYHNGEQQRIGTDANIAAGVADVSIGTDVGSNGNIKFRYDITSSDVICVVKSTVATADETGEITGTRRKVSISPTGGLTAGSYLSITGLALADYSYDGDKIDVYSNGELQIGGTESEVNSGAADYFIGTDNSGAGRIKFRYNLATNDNIIVIARQMARTEPENVGGEGTGRNPFYYGAHGHATIMWDGDTLASPFTELYHTDAQNGPWFHHNTVPVYDDSIDLQTKSIVTKGVTAFLLKESDILDENIRKSNFHQKSRKLSLGTNLSNNSGANWNNPNSSNDVIQNVYTPIDSSLVNVEYENDSYFDTNSTRTLVGYLQHVYHNDNNPSDARNALDWVRKDRNTPVGLVPDYNGQKNLIGILDRENSTYVSGLLRTNTDVVDFHVNGAMKLQTQIDSSFPISNFKIDDIFEVNNINDPSSNNSYHVQGVFGSNEGGVDNQLTNVEFIPSYSGIAAKKQVKFPSIALPSTTTGANTTHLNAWKDTIQAVDGSKNQIEDAETILRPNDKLILGLQDSVSTCFASQQNKRDLDNNSENNTNFIRWGRNSLTIPAQQDSYIRLYIKKTRKSKTFNTVSTGKGYSANVNRPIGDYYLSDKHYVNSVTMYTGSISDDIVGPTYFTPPVIEQKIQSTGNALDGVKPFGDTAIPIAWAFGYTNLSWWTEATNSISYRNYVPGIDTETEWQDGDAQIPWFALSRAVLADTVQLPALQLRENLGSDPRNKISDAFAAALVGTIVHPQNALIDVYTSARWGKGTTVVLEEINTNSTVSYDWSNYSFTDSTNTNVTKDWNNTEITGLNSNGVGSWYQKIAFPLFEKLDHRYDPQFITIPVTFRLVQIGTYVTSGSGNLVNGNDNLNSNVGDIWSGKYPVYSDGTEMEFGDVFYFDDNNNSVKLLTASQLSAGTIPSNQKILRTWRGHKTGGQEVYIVARKGKMFTMRNLSSRPSFIDSRDSGTQAMTYNDVYGKIADVLNAQKVVESSLLYSEVESNVNGNFLNIKYPDDPIIRSILQDGKTFIDSQNSFTLLGQSAVGTTTPAFLQQAIYLKKNTGDNSTWWTTGYGSNETYNAFWHPASTYPAAGEDPTDSSTWLASTLIPDNTNTYLKGYLRSWGWADVANPTSEPWADRYHGLASYYPSDSSGGGNLSINYSGLPSSNIEITIVEETYNDSNTNTDDGADVKDIIDRKVSFRTTEKTAGPFGSLNPFTTLVASDDDVIHDSKYPKINETGTLNLDLSSTGITQGWLLHGVEEKVRKFSIRNVKTKLGADGDVNYEGKFDAVYMQEGMPIVTTSQILDTGSEEWTFGETSDTNTNWPDPIQNRYINVTNYIQKEFGGNRDYTTKTGLDLVFGIGNGVAGRHVIRPAEYKYKAFRSNDENNLIVDQESKMVIEAVIDPPRGARFGLYNISPMRGTYKFSPRSFGHLRDMLEQALDTKINASEDDNTRGSPVVISTVQPLDPDSPKIITDTKRFNKTKHATVTEPYNDENYENRPNTTNINTENLRVDVPGRLRNSQVLGPGSLSANIFRRGE